jgi:class 3 adenylate cyclase/DNA-binding beta-propeller fold protein YncE
VGDRPSASAQRRDGQRASIRTFLIADLRGYTSFTQEHGDEAASALTERFAATARDRIEAEGGSVVEMAGDEVLAEFDSPRQALRAAVRLQRGFVEQTKRDPGVPLRAGIGLDVGEAVSLDKGYRGAALNRASRLCDVARAGEILATGELVHLAGRMQGVSYQKKGRSRLKGFADPVLVIRVLPESFDPVKELARAQVRAPSKGPRRSRSVLVATVAVAVLGAAIATGIALRSSPLRHSVTPSPIGLGLIQIDPVHNRVARETAFENTWMLAAGGGSVWLGSHSGLKQFDPANNAVVATKSPFQAEGESCDAGAPCYVAVGGKSVWFMRPGGHVARIDPRTDNVIARINVGVSAGGGVFYHGALWVTDPGDEMLVKIDGRTNKRTHSTPVSAASGRPSTIAAGAGSVFVADRAGGTISRVDPRTAKVTRTIPVPNASGVAVGGGGVWVIDSVDNSLIEYDAHANMPVLHAIHLASIPTAIAYGFGSVWVAEGQARQIVRIDSQSGTTRARIFLSDVPADIAIGLGRVWVTPGGLFG